MWLFHMWGSGPYNWCEAMVSRVLTLNVRWKGISSAIVRNVWKELLFGLGRFNDREDDVAMIDFFGIYWETSSGEILKAPLYLVMTHKRDQWSFSLELLKSKISFEHILEKRLTSKTIWKFIGIDWNGNELFDNTCHAFVFCQCLWKSLLSIYCLKLSELLN